MRVLYGTSWLIKGVALHKKLSSGFKVQGNEKELDDASQRWFPKTGIEFL